MGEIRNQYTQDFTCPEVDTPKAKLYHYFIDFYVTLPSKHASTLRANQNLERQFGKQGSRVKEQEMRYWNVLLQEFINYQNREDFLVKLPELQVEYDAFVLKLKSKLIHLDPRFGFYFKKSIWDNL